MTSSFCPTLGLKLLEHLAIAVVDLKDQGHASAILEELSDT